MIRSPRLAMKGVFPDVGVEYWVWQGSQAGLESSTPSYIIVYTVKCGISIQGYTIYVIAGWEFTETEALHMEYFQTVTVPP